MKFLLFIAALIAGASAGGDPTVKSKLFEGDIGNRAYLGTAGDVILLRDASTRKLWRSGNFGSDDWTEPSGLGSEQVLSFKAHDHEKSRVFATTVSGAAFYSKDSGASFSKMSFGNINGLPSGISASEVAKPNTLGVPLWDFHPSVADYLLYVGGVSGPNAQSVVLLSKDNGASWNYLTSYVSKCVFGQDVKFTSVNAESIFCLRYDPQSGNQETFSYSSSLSVRNLQLVLFNSFTDASPRVLTGNVIQFYVFEKFLGVAVQEGNNVTLKTTTDGSALYRTSFPPGEFDSFAPTAYTILQSPNGRIFVDAFVSTSSGNEMGFLYSSTSDGLRFGRSSPTNTNRNSLGFVDYERFQFMEGVIYINVVENADVVKVGEKKRIVSKVSVDDGFSWNSMTLEGTSTKLHIHSRSELTYTGPIYSIKNGTVAIAVGNTGDSLLDMSVGLTYMSRDAGQTWRQIFSFPSAHEILGYGSLIVLARTDVQTTEISYSVDDGINWSTRTVLDTPMIIKEIVGMDDGRGFRAIVVGFTSGTSVKPAIVALDFSSCFDRDCGTSDFEDMKVRPGCFLGRNEGYKRRTSTVKCAIKSQDFFRKRSDFPTCACGSGDLDCAIGFYREKIDSCVKLPGFSVEPVGCSPGSVYQAPSGYFLAPTSECTTRDTFDKLKSTEQKCSGAAPTTPIDNTKRAFTFTSRIKTILHFSNSSRIIALLNSNEVFASVDVGNSWFNTGIKDCQQLLQNSYFPNVAYAMTSSSVYYRIDSKIETVSDLSNEKNWITARPLLPAAPNEYGFPILEFHAKERDFLIFIGKVCPSPSSCHANAYYTKDGGSKWELLREHAVDCEWGVDSQFTEVNRLRVYCQSSKDKSGSQYSGKPSQLDFSEDFFRTVTPVFPDANVQGFAIVEQFMVAALKVKDVLTIKVSADGDTWADAIWPPGTDLSSGYTVLESNANRMLINVLTKNDIGHIYISNRNATIYSLAHANVNRNGYGYADFEHMLGVDGVSIINVVANADEAVYGAKKKLTTMITYDNGFNWFKLNVTDCTTTADNADSCTLNLHTYTERNKLKNEMSDAGAVGMFIGVGNTGSFLKPYADSDMYLSTDAGIHWKKVRSGPHLFEFGDHGNILVMADAVNPIRSVWYSLDHGASFLEMKLSLDSPIVADRLLIEPDGTGLQFVLFGSVGGTGSFSEYDASQYGAVSIVALPLNFNQTRERQCGPLTGDDFETITVKDPAGDDCYLGERRTYYRRKGDRNCFIGEALDGLSIATPDAQLCQCKREDYECSFGYYVKDGACVEVAAGFANKCSAPYMKMQQSKCTGYASGLDATNRCSIGGGSAVLTIFAVLLPLALIGAGGFVYYRRRQSREGAIRLGEVSENVRGWFNGIDWKSWLGRPRYAPITTRDTDVLMDDY